MPLLFLYLRTLFQSLTRTLYLLLTLSISSPSLFVSLPLSSPYLSLSSFLSFHRPFSPSIPLNLSVSLLSLSLPLSVSISLSLSLSLSLPLHLPPSLTLSFFPIFSIFRLGRAVIRLGRWGGVTGVEWAENKSSYRECSYEQTALWYWKRDPAFAIQFNR